MLRKILRRTLFAIPVLLLAYLAIAALWANSALDQLMASYPAPANTSALSTRQQEILLKIEDPTFFEHRGLSLADGQGMTTISSSSARAVFLEGANLAGIQGAFQYVYRGVFACCKKVDLGRDVMALVLDARVSKERQLGLYIAQVYMGTQAGVQVKGLEQASMLYFQKPLKELDEQGFIGLVSMIKGPNQFHPVHNKQAFDVRRQRVAAVISGACKPSGWLDTSFDHCKST